MLSRQRKHLTISHKQMNHPLRATLAKGKTKAVIAELLTHTAHDSDLHNQVVQLSARFAQYEKQKLGNLEAPEVLGVELNKINQTALAIINELAQDPIQIPVPDTEYPTIPSANNPVKNLLTLVALGLAAVAIYFLFDWYKADPQNKEPLPALLSAIATFIMLIVAWRYNETPKSPGVGWFNTNTVVIKGNKNTVSQGNGGHSTMGINKAAIEGDNNQLEQGKKNNP